MHLVYISSNVSAVQMHLVESIRNNAMDCVLCTYTINRKSNKGLQVSHDMIQYRSHSVFKGPLFYLTRLKIAAHKLNKKLDRNSIDVFHANMMFGDGLIARTLSDKHQVPYVLSIRNTDLNLWFLWKLPWIKVEGMKNLLGADQIVFLSNTYKKKLFDLIPNNIRDKIEKKCVVIPNGVDDFWLDNIAHKKERNSQAITFLTVGRLEYNKNQIGVARALKEYSNRTGNSIQYIVVGDCPDEDIRNQLLEYDFVTLLPFQHKEQLIDTFRSSDIYIMASHTETFGLVYAEALTQGLPIIYTRGQGFDEQFSEGYVGYSVDSSDLESILHGIDKTVSNYDDIIKHTTEASYKFQWDKISKELILSYNRACINYKNNENS